MAACAVEAAAARRRVRGCGWSIVFVFVCARERFGGALWLMDVVCGLGFSERAHAGAVGMGAMREVYAIAMVYV